MRIERDQFGNAVRVFSDNGRFEFRDGSPDYVFVHLGSDQKPREEYLQYYTLPDKKEVIQQWRLAGEIFYDDSNRREKIRETRLESEDQARQNFSPCPRCGTLDCYGDCESQE